VSGVGFLDLRSESLLFWSGLDDAARNADLALQVARIKLWRKVAPGVTATTTAGVGLLVSS
jgi:hypothetical protein